MKLLPLFKSHYSMNGRSILTLEEGGASVSDGPDSIIDIAVEHKLPEIVLIEDSFGGFLEAYQNCKKAKIKLIFGIRLNFTLDCSEKTEESLGRNHKLIIFARNSEGYKRLTKIYTKACSAEYSYYEPRMDFKTLKEFWDERDLKLCVPFYDSFLFNNALTYNQCVPDFGFASPTFFTEKNGLPFDHIVHKRVIAYAGDKYPVVAAKSVFYKKRHDFKSYLVFKAIHNRSTLSNPNLPHCSSDEFCMESWAESQ